MGKTTGFLEYERKERALVPPLERIKSFEEFHIPAESEEVIRQAARCMDCGTPYCQAGRDFGGKFTGCPLHNLIPEYNDEVFFGRFRLAYDRLVKTNNFPEFTGRVCPAFCENACICNLNGEAVTTHDNEYAVIETAFENGWVKPCPPSVRTGKRVAVIGSGPAGLAAADCLNKRGHFVTVFERDNMPGGLLMYGIPNMKLDKSVIKRRTDIMEAEGIVFKCNVNVGAPTPLEDATALNGAGHAADKTIRLSAEEVLKDFDAVILCCGAKLPRDVDVPGRDADGIYYAVDFLTDSTKKVTGQKKRLHINASGKNVVVVGGGDTGNDCVATAIREGAKSVVQLDRNPKGPESFDRSAAWPFKPNVYRPDYGHEEAIALFGHEPRMFSSTVKEIIKDKRGCVKKIVTIQIKKRIDQKTGRKIITELPGTEQIIPCNMLIIAAGFAGCEPYAAEAFKAGRTKAGTIDAPGDSYRTANEKVFAAGDARRGQSLVVWAISEGRGCAKEVDKYLMGYSNM